ncbi:unnamed protein product [Orchesella dallaii]|uniref:Uncharacterized protein n=1 Tax=Orchesella dallaii TaxID=48710 RepID=A0ABP1RT60_9HEXA
MGGNILLLLIVSTFVVSQTDGQEPQNAPAALVPVEAAPGSALGDPAKGVDGQVAPAASSQAAASDFKALDSAPAADSSSLDEGFDLDNGAAIASGSNGDAEIAPAAARQCFFNPVSCFGYRAPRPPLGPRRPPPYRNRNK